MNKKSLTESEIKADIRRVARLLNHSPSSVEYRQLGHFNIRTLQRKFDQPWKQIVESVGLRYTPRTSRRIPTTEELRRDVLRVARALCHPPNRFEFQAHGRFDAETVRRRSKKKHWEDAVAWLTGIDREEVKFHQRRGACYRTTEEWLARLRELARELGHAPTTQESNQGGINAHSLRLRVGGSWADVLAAAGIDLKTRSGLSRLRSTTTETLLEDVLRVSRRLGRPAKMREYETHGRYSWTAIRGRLGGWRNVKKQVAESLAKKVGRR